jgi:hypothetical protein
MKALQAFTQEGLSYRPVQVINGHGTLWRCDYPDGEYSLAMIYKNTIRKADVIAAAAELETYSARGSCAGKDNKPAWSCAEFLG